MQSSNKNFNTSASIDTNWWYYTKNSSDTMKLRRFLKRQKSKSLRCESQRVLRMEEW